MRDPLDKSRDERGAALITTLMILLLLTILGFYSIHTATTETTLGGNERLNRQAYYLAEAGIQEAIARFDVNDSGSGYYISKSDVKNLSAYPWLKSGISWSRTFTRSDGFTNYSVYIIPSFENDPSSLGGGFHYYTTVHYTDQLVLYNKKFLYPDSPIEGGTEAKDGFPVYHVVSIGKVRDSSGNVLAMSKLMADVTENTINTEVPGAMYSGVCVNMHGSYQINAPGDVAVVTPCTDSLSPYSSHISGAKQPSAPMKNMSTFLGMGLDRVKQLATKTYIGGSTEPGVHWGNYATETDPQVVWVDNACQYTGGAPCTSGEFKINGDQGYGILVVTGDVTIEGNFQFKGLVYVMGNFKTTGTGAHIVGGLMVKGHTQTDVGGNATIELNRDILEKVAQAGCRSKMIVWKEIRE